MLLDTHLHLVNRDHLTYPWLDSVPALNRDWRYDDYAITAARLGVIGALHMEVDVTPDQIEAESGMVADLMAQPGSLIRGAISSARPEAPGFAAWLDQQDRGGGVAPACPSTSAWHRGNCRWPPH